MAHESNQARLLNYLVNKRGYSSAKEIASAIHVSPKTVYRIIKHINAQNEEQQLIQSQRGLGYSLNYAAYLAQHPELNRSRQQHVGEFTSVERRSHILRQLLVTAPEKHALNDIFGKFYLSESVISSDIRIIRQMIGQYGLKLNRRNDYLWITGDEQDIRTVINDLMISDDDISISHFLKSNEHIHQSDASFITRQINYIEEKLASSIPYPYDVNLFSHLYILVERYHQVGTLVAHQNVNQEVLEHLYPKIIKVLQQVIANISKYLQTQIPMSEAYNLYQYLSASRLENQQVVTMLEDDSASPLDKQVTRFLIDTVSADERIENIDKKALNGMLVKHIRPMLNRLSHNIKIKNALLNQVKLEYPELFSTVQLATNQASRRFHLRPINEDEVGFITVYFAQAIEQVHHNINTLVVCTTGLGTAQLLKTKISNRFPMLNIVQTTSADKVLKVLQERHDIQLIVSTLKLPALDTVHELVVSALFTNKDQERLGTVINQIHGIN
ncbi:BglG family transcription antiterminator [Limosilactobacillus difficilis]|uniref:BglG family transcription antiterminator n=1 Tax=Limosilactobacillus difficilis TaxID=2991838 RepID=UPI0024BA0509|nr:PRD domain-containing protein [Limosilactobacillus difficilis]